MNITFARSEFLWMIADLLHYAEEQHIGLVCFCFYRSPEEQLREYAAGRSRLKFGAHQLWLAMDFARFEDANADGSISKEELRWSRDEKYEKLGRAWKDMGGVWGGDWGSLNDIYHFEYSKWKTFI